MRGMGDLLAYCLKPLEPLIRRFGPKKGCGCKKRQEVLNQIVPFKSKHHADPEFLKRKMAEYQKRIEKIEKSLDKSLGNTQES